MIVEPNMPHLTPSCIPLLCRPANVNAMRSSPVTDNSPVTAAIASPPPPVQPLSEAHLRELATAHQAARKIRRVLSIARFDAWTIAIFAGLTLLFGFGDWSNFFIGGALGIVAAVEFRAIAQLRRLNPAAVKTLARNQLALGALLMIYSLWRLYTVLYGKDPNAILEVTDPSISQMLIPFADLTRRLSMLVYGVLLATAVFAQGGLALYYFSREKLVRAYVRDTPPWIIAVQQTGAAI
jgi:hypothetical protein